MFSKCRPCRPNRACRPRGKILSLLSLVLALVLSGFISLGIGEAWGETDGRLVQISPVIGKPDQVNLQFALGDGSSKVTVIVPAKIIGAGSLVASGTIKQVGDFFQVAIALLWGNNATIVSFGCEGRGSSESGGPISCTSPLDVKGRAATGENDVGGPTPDDLRRGVAAAATGNNADETIDEDGPLCPPGEKECRKPGEPSIYNCCNEKSQWCVAEPDSEPECKSCAVGQKLCRKPWLDGSEEKEEVFCCGANQSCNREKFGGQPKFGDACKDLPTPTPPPQPPAETPPPFSGIYDCKMTFGSEAVGCPGTDSQGKSTYCCNVKAEGWGANSKPFCGPNGTCVDNRLDNYKCEDRPPVGSFKTCGAVKHKSCCAIEASCWQQTGQCYEKVSCTEGQQECGQGPGKVCCSAEQNCKVNRKTLAGTCSNPPSPASGTGGGSAGSSGGDATNNSSNAGAAAGGTAKCGPVTVTCPGWTPSVFGCDRRQDYLTQINGGRKTLVRLNVNCTPGQCGATIVHNPGGCSISTQGSSNPSAVLPSGGSLGECSNGQCQAPLYNQGSRGGSNRQSSNSRSRRGLIGQIFGRR